MPSTSTLRSPARRRRCAFAVPFVVCALAVLLTGCVASLDQQIRRTARATGATDPEFTIMLDRARKLHPGLQLDWVTHTGSDRIEIGLIEPMRGGSFVVFVRENGVWAHDVRASGAVGERNRPVDLPR
jgi:hypothetical protein